MCCFSAFSAVADPDLQKRWRSNHPDPEISGGGGDVRGGGGGGSQKVFWFLLASFLYKNRGQAPRAPFQDLPLPGILF